MDSPPSPTSPWTYSYDASFSNPVYLDRIIRTTGPASPVALARANLQPEGGFKAALSNAPISSSNETKIIYAVRHGDTPHNEDSKIWGKPVAWRYLARLGKNFDPSITEEGVRNSTAAAGHLSTVVNKELAPRPVTVYSSPLKRCIQTTMYMIKQARLDEWSPDRRWPPVTLRIKEGLREWMGYGHMHQSDRKGTKAEIQATFEGLRAELGVDVSYELDVPEQDALRDEVYVDVDRRVRGVLDEIFSDARSGACVMIVLHNRTNKSFLRVLGHPPAAVDNFEVANCAVLTYRVTRHLLSSSEVAERVINETIQWGKDQHLVEDTKSEALCKAVEQVKAWNDDPSLRPWLESLMALLNRYKGHPYHDPAARSALRILEGDLKHSKG